MRKIKSRFRRNISVICILAMLVQIFSGYPGMLVSADNSGKSDFQLAIEETEYTAVYAEAETAEQAQSTAEAQVKKVIGARSESSENTATVELTDGSLNINAKGGTYTFKATVTLSDNSSFTTDAVNMKIAARPEAVKVVFDSAEKLKDVYVGGAGNVTKACVDNIADGGKAYLQIKAGGGTDTVDQQTILDFAKGLNLDAYPYVKISYRHNREQASLWETAQLFVKSDELGSWDNYEFYPYNTGNNSDNDRWNEVLLDMKAVKAYYSKKQDNETISHSATDKSWTGKNAELRIDFTNGGTSEREVDIEYIAFFGSKEEAEAYPVELGNLQSVLENAEYTAEYAEAETVAMLTPIAEKQVQAVLDKWNKDNDAAATFVMGEKAELNRYVSGGTFVFDIAVTQNDESVLDVTLTMKIAARPNPTAIVFDSAEKLKDVYVGGAGNVTKAYVDNSADGGKSYLQIKAGGGTDTVDQQTILNFAKGLNLDAYPYVKISYRHNREQANLWETAQLFVKSDTLGSWDNYEFYPYNTGNNSDNDRWNEVLLDMKAVKAYYSKSQDNGTISHSATDKSWTGKNAELRIDFTNGGTCEREVDIEYIAFFASEAQAKAYPNLPDDTVDVSREKLSEAKFSCESSVAATEADARNEISSQIEKLELPAAYTLENGIYVAATTSTEGSYTVDVVFQSSGDKVTVIMKIEKTSIVPVVWTFDNRSVLSQFTGTNAKMIYENGYVKMTTEKIAYDDGFFLQGSPTDSEKFDISTLPYVKLKYKITGAESAPLQFFYWLDNGHYYYRTFNGNDASWDGDTVTVIADMSVLTTGTTAVWINNLTKNTSKNLSFDGAGADAGSVISKGTVTQLRFNLARQAHLDRTAEVEYIGFFPTYEAAAAYEGAGNERVEAAEKYLKDHTLEMRWALGSTQEKAVEGAKTAIDEAGVGCTEIKDVQYVQPTTEAMGSITCTAVLKSAEAVKEVSVTVKIGKKPSEPIVWRFNDSEFLNKLTYAYVKATIEDNVAKMVSTNPVKDDGFYFIVNLPEDTEQFYLEDYGYIRMKYKREGLAPAQLYFYSDALYGNPNLGSLGYGREEGDWYTSIIDTSVNNFTDTMIYNYNHRTGVTENFVKYAANGYNKYTWQGLSTAFRFNFGRRGNLDRTLYLEYIAFFPTLEDAQAYDEENERLKSNAQVALKSYSGSEADYYEGNTAAAAQETAGDHIAALTGDEVKNVIHTVSYTAPVMNESDGSYVFTADICNLEGKVLYTTPEYTMTISKQVDTSPVVFTFTNPDFIARVSGDTPKAENYSYMKLSGSDTASFTLPLKSEEKFHLAGHPYLVLKAEAETARTFVQLNDKKYELSFGTPGDTTLILDFENGSVYQNGEKRNDITLKDIVKENIKKLGITFDEKEAKVYYMGFFATLEEAQAYTGESAVLKDTLSAIGQLSLNCAYADAETKNAALSHAITRICAAVGTEVSLVSTKCTGYTAATAQKQGSITVQATIGVGSQKDSHYAVTTITVTIGKKPSEPIVWKFDEAFVKKLIPGGNVTLSSQNSILIMDTKSDSAEDGFYFTMDTEKDGSGFYLQDYPYVKIKYRYHSSGDSTGISQFYFFNDETTGSREYTMGTVERNDTWCSALLDMKENTITLCDLEKESLLSSTAMTGTVAFHGTTKSFRVNMGRRVTCQRHAEIEYIAFFASREEAESYQRDYAYSAYEFNGKEYATAAKQLTATPSTIETVIKTANKTAMTILSNEQKDTDDYYALETTSEGKVKFVYGGSEVLCSNQNVCDGEWHQIAVTLEEGKAVLYIDGTEAAVRTDFSLNSKIFTKAPQMARDYKGQNAFVGQIYYIRLFNTVQTVEELTTKAFNRNYTDKVLTAWFTDELTTSEQFADVCAANPMTLRDNYDYEGHEFLGNDYIKTEKILTGEPKTFEFWMKNPKETATGTYTILSNRKDGNSSGTAIELTDGQLRMVYNGTTLFTTEGISFADNTWKHVAVTLDTAISVYIDGKLVKTYTTAYSTGSEACAAYYIGAGLESTKTPYVGRLSDVRIWSSVRSQEEIAQNMQDYLKTAAKDLLASWRLDTQTYLKYTDYSSNENTGSLYSSGWYKLENITGDYTMGAIGDTQSYMQTTPSLFADTFRNLAEKVDDFNMKYLFHLGDVTQNSTLMEWEYARQAFDYIEGKVPYSIILGNHDYPSPSSGTGAEFRSAANFNKVFPMSNFKNQTLSSLGGAYEENDVSNIYTFFSVGNVEYIVFSLEYGPRDEVLEWAGKVLDRYPQKCAIILTHGYFAYGGNDNSWGSLLTDESIYNAAGSDFDTANGGQAIWDKLLKKHDNIALLLCGHSQNPYIVYRETKGDYGNNVVQMMVDHSAMVTGFPSKEGLMTLLSFDEDTGVMHTYWYSPLYDAYYSTENEMSFDVSDNLIDKKEYYKEYTDISSYRSGDVYTYPTAEKFGYVFAGWYDAETKEPLGKETVTGKALAKFVDADVLSVKFQAGLEKTDSGYAIPTDKAKIRFVTTVDSLRYRDVAFMISLEKEDGTFTTQKSTSTETNRQKVWERLYAVGMSTGEPMDYLPTVFSSHSCFFKTYTLNDIPAAAYDKDIRVTPYWETLDGTIVYGKQRTICVNDIMK